MRPLLTRLKAKSLCVFAAAAAVVVVVVVVVVDAGSVDADGVELWPWDFDRLKKSCLFRKTCRFDLHRFVDSSSTDV